MSDEFITPEKFCDAWKKVWADKGRLSRKLYFKDIWCKSEKGWTGYMLGRKTTSLNSFLECVVKELMGFNRIYENELLSSRDQRVVADKNKCYPNSKAIRICWIFS